MFLLQNYKNISKAAVLLKAVFFLFAVVFIHPTVTYTDWCLVHSYSYTQEISSHSGHISEHLLFEPTHDENVAHIEETAEHCVDASSSFIQSSSIKSPEIKIAVAYFLQPLEFVDSIFVDDSFLNHVKNAPSQHLSILRSIVLTV